MKKLFILPLLLLSISLVAQNSTTKQVLLDQLKSTHNAKNWFVDVNSALQGISAEQAAWKDKGNHSVGQLAYHIYFWNERALRDFRGEAKPDFKGSNDETFDNFDQKQWANMVKQVDQVMTEIEKWLEKATPEQLAKHATTLANISAHNAYHTGQIVSVRKAQGSWDPEKGVK